jgi:glutamate formiminotransferase/glutamate formiminotransferase/formiminotetrahydrofolate cyclodeaminase
VLECVINISEGQNSAVLADLSQSVRGSLLDVHTDPDHNRSVFTLVGTDTARVFTRTALQLCTLDNHHGVHPRLGVVDVVPFVPLGESTMADAVAARDAFAHWAARECNVPVFLYGPERTLPDIRKSAWKSLLPDVGPTQPDRRAGAICAGAREPLVAWNMWLRNVDIATTRNIAAHVRSPQIRTLGIQVGEFTQVSCNLIAPDTHGPDVAYDLVAELTSIDRCELVGLLPRTTLEKISPDRWETLDLDDTKTIEWRLAHRFSR